MNICPQCETSNTDEAKFCRSCGNRLHWAPPVVPVEEFSVDATPVATEPAVNTGSPPAVPATAPTVAPVSAMPDEMRAQLGGSSKMLWGALAVVGVVLVAGLSWLLGRRHTRPETSNPPPIIVQMPATSTSAPVVNQSDSSTGSDLISSGEPVATKAPAATPTPNAVVQERAAILRTVENWRVAWQNQNIDSYMAAYAPDAQIFSNRKWYSRDAYEEHERDLFSHGGTIRVTPGYMRVKVNGSTAEVSFPFTFQRWGGKGNFRSRGHQKFQMRKNDTGEWVIVQDVFTKR